MSLQSDLQAAMRATVGIFSQTWQYRSLTSAYDAEAMTYGTAANFTAQKVGETIVQEYSEERRDYVKRARATLKCTDAVTLKVGDQVIEPTTTKHWHVLEPQDATDIDGIKRYVIERTIDLKGGDRSRTGA